MLATLMLTVFIFLIIIVVLLWVRTPRYRIERENVIALLKLVLDGQASENDWQVFISVPLRHDSQLEAIRQRCIDIEEREYLGSRRSGHMFSPRGLHELREILQDLEPGERKEQEKV